MPLSESFYKACLVQTDADGSLPPALGHEHNTLIFTAFAIFRDGFAQEMGPPPHPARCMLKQPNSTNRRTHA